MPVLATPGGQMPRIRDGNHWCDHVSLDLRCMHVFERAGATGYHGYTHHLQATLPHTMTAS